MCACVGILPWGSAAYEGKTLEALGVGRAAPGAHARPPREARHRGNDKDACLAHGELLVAGAATPTRPGKPAVPWACRHNAGCTPAPPATNPSCGTHVASS